MSAPALNPNATGEAIPLPMLQDPLPLWGCHPLTTCPVLGLGPPCTRRLDSASQQRKEASSTLGGGKLRLGPWENTGLMLNVQNSKSTETGSR